MRTDEEVDKAYEDWRATDPEFESHEGDLSAEAAWAACVAFMRGQSIASYVEEQDRKRQKELWRYKRETAARHLELARAAGFDDVAVWQEHVRAERERERKEHAERIRVETCPDCLLMFKPFDGPCACKSIQPMDFKYREGEWTR